MILYIHFRDFTNFRTDVIKMPHEIFLSITPTKVVLRLNHRILLHIGQSSFSGLWVILPRPNHLTSIKSPNHNRVKSTIIVDGPHRRMSSLGTLPRIPSAWRRAYQQRACQLNTLLKSLFSLFIFKSMTRCV